MDVTKLGFFLFCLEQIREIHDLIENKCFVLGCIALPRVTKFFFHSKLQP